MVKVGNINYFIGVIFALLFIISIYLFLRKKDQKIIDKTIIIILFLNLALHFLKICFERYVSNLPNTLRKITFENICAISTIIYPFIYLSRSRICNTYLFFISLVGGLVAVIYPMEVLNKPMWCFDTIRFYLCHIVLLSIPILLGLLNVFKPRFKDWWVIPTGFILISILIFINEIILIRVGFVSSSVDQFFDRSIRNSSFVFGPLPAFDSMMGFFKLITPKFLRTNYWMFDVDMFFMPVLWMIVPVYIIFPIIYEVLILPFNYKEIIKKIKRKEGI